MKILLDTHVFLWFISGDIRLPVSFRDQTLDPGNEVFLSVVSIWEAIIKSQLGKLPLPEPPEIYIPEQRKRHGITSLDVNEGSVVELAKLPSLHRDPFDRLLISQAIQHGLTLVTVDQAVRAYPVTQLTIY
jgi:PIN domain nuclease of toxin-antitoxin system